MQRESPSRVGRSGAGGSAIASGRAAGFRWIRSTKARSHVRSILTRPAWSLQAVASSQGSIDLPWAGTRQPGRFQRHPRAAQACESLDQSDPPRFEKPSKSGHPPWHQTRHMRFVRSICGPNQSVLLNHRPDVLRGPHSAAFHVPYSGHRARVASTDRFSTGPCLVGRRGSCPVRVSAE